MRRSQRTQRRRKKPRRRKTPLCGEGFDLQKLLAKTGIEFHWLGYQYMGSGMHLAKRSKRGDPAKNRLDRLAKQHNIDYSRAKTLQDN